MPQRRSDMPVYLAAVAAVLAAGAIIYSAVNVAMAPGALDSNTPNATTGGPPSSFGSP